MKWTMSAAMWRAVSSSAERLCYVVLPDPGGVPQPLGSNALYQTSARPQPDLYQKAYTIVLSQYSVKLSAPHRSQVALLLVP